jgi:PAS domain S-box-containing protein
MTCDECNAESLLAHQLRPALALDAHGTIVAANHGSRRLIAPSRLVPYSNTHNSLLGKNIAELGLVPQPGQTPVLWTWLELLLAAKNAVRSEGTRRNSSGQRYHAMAIDILADTENFWDEEAEQQGIIETNVYVTRQGMQFPRRLAYDTYTDFHTRADWELGTLGTGEPVKRSSMIKTRAAVHWLPRGNDGYFFVTFNRTALPVASVPMPVTTLSDTVSHLFDNIEEPNHHRSSSVPHADLSEASRLNTNPSVEEPMPGASDVASSIIPFIMATLDTDGQVTNLSESWYRFSGLDVEGSLGAGWMTVMHPDDVVEITTDWSDVLRNERSHWTHQARFRKSLDGSYCWFLIRVQPYKNASGKVLRWYASMMDINEWVMARLEADRRRQVMLTLFSQTDVMLWGIDRQNHMYICEGRLDWDPSIIEKLSQPNYLGQHANLASHDPSRDELVSTVRAVLQGDKFNPIVEHWEGDRYFRTQFVAERAAHGGSVQAALALTFDITDERARTTLQVENQRLVNNEKAALDAAKLKSSFLANVSQSRASFMTLTLMIVDVSRNPDPYIGYNRAQRTPAGLRAL